MSSNFRILGLAFVTLVAFPLVAFVFLYLIEGVEYSFFDMFKTKSSYFSEIILGCFTGVVAGFMAWQLITSRYLRAVLDKYGGMVQSLELKMWQIVMVSICAGVGEEIFFRGMMQNYFGVWITAIFFVAIHGYLSYKDQKILVYGLFMTLVIAFVGWLDLRFGLTSAMLAHTLIDVVLFYKLTTYKDV